jgi:hydrogenase maturation protein HypF
MVFDNRGENDSVVIDWAPMIRALLVDLEQGVPQGEIAAKFHNALVDVIVAMAHKTGEEKVVLSGGCFQNRYLTERAVVRLQRAGYRPYWHRRIPPNDGGLALGQVFAAARAARRR